MTTGTITQIYRYPVKSMGGEALDQTDVGDKGVLGDRAWAVRDEVKGGIKGAKKFPALMQCHARYLDTPSAERPSARAEIELPDGSLVSTGEESAASQISAAIGNEVSLWPLVSIDDLEHYRRTGGEALASEEGLRAVFAREPGEPLPDLSVFPAELMEYESPLGTYFDAFPLLIMTQAALDFVQSKAGESMIDVRRFRPNFVVNTGESSQGFVEEDWAGKKMRIGGLTVQAEVICPRCVMTTHGFDELPKDPTIMRTLVRETGGHLGVYASVLEPGEVRLGDEIEILPG